MNKNVYIAMLKNHLKLLSTMDPYAKEYENSENEKDNLFKIIIE